MKLNLTDKDISSLKVVSQIAGGFTLIVALTMIFSLIQLKTINPLDNPVLVSVKEQFDKDPANASKAEQLSNTDVTQISKESMKFINETFVLSVALNSKFKLIAAKEKYSYRDMAIIIKLLKEKLDNANH